ncbi:MAG: thioesterase family protein [Porticoccaceae bacterium]
MASKAPNPATAAMSKFERDTQVRRIDERVWEGEFSPDWSIGQAPNGGYAMALGARALAAVLPHPDPMTVTAYYVARPASGPVRCEVEVLRVGKGTSTGMVRMVQGGETMIQLLGTYTDLDRIRGVNHCTVPMPAMPDFAACIDTPVADNVPLRKQLVQRMTPANVQALEGTPDGSGCWLGWTDFADGGPIDLFGLLLFSDAMPPPAFSLYGPEGWVPTLDLSVQIHARPAPGPLRCQFETRLITEGTLDEDGWLWDSQGRLVALARQTAKLRVKSGKDI